MPKHRIIIFNNKDTHIEVTSQDENLPICFRAFNKGIAQNILSEILHSVNIACCEVKEYYQDSLIKSFLWHYKDGFLDLPTSIITEVIENLKNNPNSDDLLETEVAI